MCLPRQDRQSQTHESSHRPTQSNRCTIAACLEHSDIAADANYKVSGAVQREDLWSQARSF
jgi:hypothetical protein